MVAPLLAKAIGVSAINSKVASLQKAAARDVVGGMSINVTSNVSAVAKALDAFGKNQMPFAMSQALNDAAFAVRKDTIERVWPSSITQRNPAFMKAMLMPIRGDNRATKRRLRSIVQNHPTGKRNKDYLQRLAVGGIKRPNGNNLAIPANDMPMRARGGVTARNRPRNVLNMPKVFKNKLPNGQEFIACLLYTSDAADE